MLKISNQWEHAVEHKDLYLVLCGELNGKKPPPPTKWGCMYQLSSVQSFSRVRLFAIPWAIARQASLSITNSRSPPKPMSIESVMPSNHPILCHPLFLLPPILPSIRVFSNESAFRIKWPKYWSFSFSISLDICIHVTDSLCHIAETDTAV